MARRKKQTQQVEIELPAETWEMLERIAKAAHVSLDQVVNVLLATGIELQKIAGK